MIRAPRREARVAWVGNSMRCHVGDSTEIRQLSSLRLCDPSQSATLDSALSQNQRWKPELQSPKLGNTFLTGDLLAAVRRLWQAPHAHRLGIHNLYSSDSDDPDRERQCSSYLISAEQWTNRVHVLLRLRAGQIPAQFESYTDEESRTAMSKVGISFSIKVRSSLPWLGFRVRWRKA